MSRAAGRAAQGRMTELSLLSRETWELLLKRPRTGPVRLEGAGRSMWPFVRQGDAVLVEPGTPARVRVGDVVLADLGRERGLALHRVVATDSQAVLLKGDGNARADGWFDLGAVLGLAVALCRAHRNPRDLRRHRERLLARVIAAASRQSPRLWRLASPARRVLRALRRATRG